METSNTIILRIWKCNKSSCIQLTNFNLDSNAGILKEEAMKRMNFTENGIVMVYRGLVFEDDRSVSSYGVTSGCTVHVLEKPAEAKQPERTKLSEVELKQLMLSFKSLKSSNFSSLRTALQRLSKSEVLENIIAAAPGLADDPAALAILQDPELVIEMTQPETIAEIAEKHPALIEAAYHIAAHIQDQRMNSNMDQPTSSGGYAYWMDALSEDDDDMEDDTPDIETALSRSNSDTAINAAQLAEAIADATNNVLNSENVNVTGVDQTTERTPGFGSVITHEAISNAIQQAFAASRLGVNNTPISFQPENTSPFTAQANRNSGGNNVNQSAPNIPNRWQTQLQKMHELGLTDDVINNRALDATSGDIQAAIELIFAGVFN